MDTKRQWTLMWKQEEKKKTKEETLIKDSK